MTAVDRLAALELAHAAATPGPWVQHDADGAYVLGQYISEDEYLDVADAGGWRKGYEQERADAAAIVAEHNATPALIAALRAVLELHQEDPGQWCAYCGPLSEGDSAALWPCDTVRAIDAALGVDSGQQT